MRRLVWSVASMLLAFGLVGAMPAQATSSSDCIPGTVCITVVSVAAVVCGELNNGINYCNGEINAVLHGNSPAGAPGQANGGGVGCYGENDGTCDEQFLWFDTPGWNDSCAWGALAAESAAGEPNDPDGPSCQISEENEKTAFDYWGNDPVCLYVWTENHATAHLTGEWTGISTDPVYAADEAYGCQLV